MVVDFAVKYLQAKDYSPWYSSYLIRKEKCLLYKKCFFKICPKGMRGSTRYPHIDRW